jgi:hypothetical protein
MRHLVVDNKNLGSGFVRTGIPVTTPRWEYKILLPNFSESQSVYSWSLILHRHVEDKPTEIDESEIVATGRNGILLRKTPASEQYQLLNGPVCSTTPGYKPYTTTTLLYPDQHPKRPTLIIKGSIEAIPDDQWLNIKSATLLLTYWPDRHLENDCAEMILIKN